LNLAEVFSLVRSAVIHCNEDYCVCFAGCGCGYVDFSYNVKY